MFKLKRSMRREQGASMIEYALVLAFVVAVAATVIGTGESEGSFTTAIKAKFTEIAAGL